MVSITVLVDEETFRLSNIRAAELGTSVPALVRGYLERFVGDEAGGTATDGPGAEADVELRRRELDEVLADFDARGVGLRSRDNLTREELYNEAKRPQCASLIPTCCSMQSVNRRRRPRSAVARSNS